MPDILQKNRELKNIHAGKCCFVIGTGPSLKGQDLLSFKDEVRIAVNHFYRHEDCKDINPEYWVCADPNFWKKQEQFLIPLLKAIEDQGINTKMFFPHFGMVKMERGAFLSLYFYMYDSAKGVNKDIDFSTGIPPYGQNVVIVALMLALFLGCNPIYLLGCDHTWWNWSREEYTDKELPHCYENEGFCPPPSEIMSYDMLQTTKHVQKFQYLQLRKYAEKRGFEIFNATEGGYLDLFPRTKYEDLFPAGSRSVDTKSLLSAMPHIASALGQSAIKLINEGAYTSALVLVDEAISQNIGKDSKVEGLDYLRAICMTGLGEHREAIKAARQDYLCNLRNRKKSLALLQALGDEEFGATNLESPSFCQKSELRKGLDTNDNRREQSCVDI